MPASAGGTPAASPRPAAASGRGRIGGYDTSGLIVLIIAVAVIFIAGKVQEHYQKKPASESRSPSTRPACLTGPSGGGDGMNYENFTDKGLQMMHDAIYKAIAADPK